MGYLEIKNITFQYSGATQSALNDCSLSIRQGEFVLLCGASGSGKSTMLKLLKPQIAPAGKQSGDIYLNNEKLTQLSKTISANKIGFVNQNPDSQIVTENTWQELAFGLENLGLDTYEIKSRIAEMVNFLGIQDLLGKPTKILSGGQKQLLNLASVLVMRPDILLLDEPTTELDPIAAQSFIEVLVRLNREMGITILMSEHSLEAIFPSVDKVVLLTNGRIILNEMPVNISNKIKQSPLDFSRFLVSLPSAVQLYHASQLDEEKCPLTVIEGKRFLERQFRKFTATPKEIKPTVKDLSKNGVSIQLNNCWFRYEKNGKDILAGVTTTFKKGEIFSLVGGNGSGKTTLLKAIAGIYNCYHGKITILNHPLKKMRKTIAYLPQEPQMLFIKDTIKEDYQTCLQNQNISEFQQQERIEEITALLGIQDSLSKHPLDLSGGECQRAALGKLLLTDPEILLLDEPTKGIDNYGKKQIIQLLKKLSIQGKTIICVTHDLHFAAELSDRCGLFFENQILTVADPSNFFSSHAFYTTAASRITREYFPDLVTIDQVIEAYQRWEDETVD